MFSKLTIFLSASLLVFSPLVVGCGDSDEDSEENQENQSTNADPGDNDSHADNNGNDNTVGGSSGQFPLDGVYEVTSHTATEDGCEGAGDPVSDDTGNYFVLDGFAMHGELDYLISFCETADAVECESWNYFISFDDEEAHTSQDLEPGIIYENAFINSRAEGGGECFLEGGSSEVEWTGNGLTIRRMQDALEFLTDEEDWECNSGDNADPDALENMECEAMEILEGTLVD